MKRKKRILVLTDDMPWGHKALAQAAYGYLKKEKDFDVSFKQVKLDAGFVNYAHGLTVKLMPAVIKHSKRIFETKTVSRIIREAGVLSTSKVKKVVDETDPDLVFSTHFMLTHALTKLRKKAGYDFSLINYISDPWTVFPVVFDLAVDKNLVYDKVTVKAGLKAGVKKVAPSLRFFNQIIWDKSGRKNPLNIKWGTFANPKAPMTRSCFENILIWAKEEFELDNIEKTYNLKGARAFDKMAEFVPVGMEIEKAMHGTGLWNFYKNVKKKKR